MVGTRFPTTRWSRVLAAAGSGETGRKALAEICRGYWQPLYAAVRRKERDPERARDLTQAFLLRFLEKNDIAMADSGRGRFRSWMLACLGNFQSNAKDAEMAWKAGGRVPHVSIDASEAEGLAANVPESALVSNDPVDPALFDRDWAVRVVERALDAMERRCKDEKERKFLAVILPLLSLPDTDPGETGVLAATLAIDEGTFKTRLSRDRKTFWRCVRKEIAETLEDPNDTDDELRHLIDVLGALWRT